MLTQRQRKLNELKSEPMEPLEYLKIEEPYLDLEEWGAYSRACRILAEATGWKLHSIRRDWGKNFEKTPLRAKLALRKDYMLNAIARQDYNLLKRLAG